MASSQSEWQAVSEHFSLLVFSLACGRGRREGAMKEGGLVSRKQMRDRGSDRVHEGRSGRRTTHRSVLPGICTLYPSRT